MRPVRPAAAAVLKQYCGAIGFSIFALCCLLAFCGKLAAMGNKDKGKKEVKKAPKPKPKPEPARRDVFTPAPPK
jgi:hypothetical protein